MTIAIAVALALAALARAGIQLWLASRQIAFARTRRSQVPPAFKGVMTAADRERAADYTAGRARIARAAAVAGAAVLLLLTLGGGVAAVDALWRETALGQPWLGAAVVLSVLGLLRLAALPFALWRTFGLEARFGFNRMSPALFAADLAKRAALGAALAAPLAAAAIVLMERGGPWWWAAAWGGWLAAAFALTFVWPRYVAPIFNRFTPLEDRALAARVAALLRRCGFASDGVFVVDGSRRSARGNAYFTGLGRNKRIVLFDTLLERLSAAEIEAVLAHELGHFRLGHLRSRLAVSAAAALCGFALLGWLAGEPGFYAALGAPTPSAHAALALALAAAPAFTFFLTPARAAWSRRHEREADDFAVGHVSPDVLAAALVAIYRGNAAELAPDPIHSAFYDTHPPPVERIARLECRGEQGDANDRVIRSSPRSSAG